MKKALFVGILVALLGSNALAYDQATTVQVTDQVLFWERNVDVPVETFLAEKPAPTVILAHACGGDRAAGQTAWAEKIRAWGFNVVKPDSFTPRGTDRDCGPTRLVSFSQRNQDFQALAKWVKAQPWHTGGVAIVGFSHGAVSGIITANDKDNRDVDAVVAYYPRCDFGGMSNPRIPVVLHLGMADDWTPPWSCVNIASGKPNFVEVNNYPNATHVFDRPLTITHYNGFKVGLEPTAARQAEASTKRFLENTIVK